MGGGFGRRLFADYVAEAVELSMILGRAVQVLWTRQDDIRHGYYPSGTVQRFRAGFDGAVQAIIHQTSVADLTVYQMHDGHDIWDGAPRKEKEATAFASPTAGLYGFPNVRIDAADVTGPVPTGPWRAVDAPADAFARESFMDELAHATRKDPFDMRIALLRQLAVGDDGVDRRRLIRVLEELRRRSTWGTSPSVASGRRGGRGMAVNVYKGTSYIGMVADVTIADDLSDIRVTRVVTVVDCGLVLNPLGLDGQTESAIAWGLSAALHGKIDFRNGAALQGSYDDFRVLRMNEMPRLETFYLESDAPPSGYGEHPVPVIAPAVANAVFAACGKRVRSLPITPRSLQA
jgi:isoquinoline 1-oxidoreductase beta subunit